MFALYDNNGYVSTHTRLATAKKKAAKLGAYKIVRFDGYKTKTVFESDGRNAQSAGRLL